MKIIKSTLLGLLGVFGLFLIWGLLEPYTIDTEEEVAEIPGLPAAWSGQRVALIADWQIGMWLGNTPTIRRIVEQLIEERPALVLIAGDFVYHAGKNPRLRLIRLLNSFACCQKLASQLMLYLATMTMEWMQRMPRRMCSWPSKYMRLSKQ